MPNVEIDGTNSTVKTNVLTSQSGTTITVPTGKVLTVTDAAGLTINGVAPLSSANDSVTTAKIVDDAVTIAKLAATGTASSSTFLRGDNAWAAAGGGAWNFISTDTADGDASVTVSGMSDTYSSYAVIISQMIPTSDGQNMAIRLGDSSGIDSGGTDYAYSLHSNRSANSSLSVTASTGSSYIMIDAQEGLGTGTGEGFSALMYIHQPSSGAMSTMISWHVQCTNAGAKVLDGQGSARRTAVISHDRIQMLMGSGNIASGRITLWGIAHS